MRYSSTPFPSVRDTPSQRGRMSHTHTHTHTHTAYTRILHIPRSDTGKCAILQPHFPVCVIHHHSEEECHTHTHTHTHTLHIPESCTFLVVIQGNALFFNPISQCA